jgi:nucleotide-binding universal stress UspA family protein/fructose-specific component phosphotransferase system IIB-like protein
MSLAKILAPLTGTARDDVVLATAFAAAKPFNAHVAALFIHPDPRLAVPFVGVPVSPEVVQDIVNASEEIAQTADKRAHDMLVAAARRAGAAIVEHPRKTDAVTCSFRRAQGLYFRAVAQAAELSDLVAFGVISGPDSVELSEGFVEVLTRSGRPVLLSAEAPAAVARKVVLGWDGGASAARAIVASLPFLRKAENIAILSIKRPGQQNEMDFADLREFLALHGLSASEQTVEQGAHPIGQALLNGAALAGADLLVMGAYSRGHLRESVFGGATAHIRSHATLPIFMAH